MTVNVLFAAGDDQWETYRTVLEQALAEAGVAANLSRGLPPGSVDYIIYSPGSELQDFTPYTRTKAVLNLWAGVENIVSNETLTQPLARMVDDGLTRGMVEWVTGHVLRHHLNTDLHVCHQDGVWRHDPPPLAPDRPVGILGLGALGRACGEALARLGFPVTGWSRTRKDVPGLTCLAGEDGLRDVLARAEILVLLLPLTHDTETIIDAAALKRMPRGAVLINPGRGPLIDDDALLAALGSGHLTHATLDVFREEPLPTAHPFWAHPQVTVTPHIASDTRPATAARVIAENIRRGESGEPLLHLVDREQGY
ncbi:2-hydroxyacid dehydrogenase [Roseovarius sp. SYSU LYC5161]|uniref:2-hydroxyacid dehydrogenase n=1 Tax=Roseovarius halophilus (ex Wu et al. 2025) TaxID=3376060 RepID=UPI002871BC13|nr:glyoxylate/hydroxypyruvate reductase A [Roseovarius sp.]